MKIVLHLRRAPSQSPATALLLLSEEPAAVLDLCERLAFDTMPLIFRVTDGFLLKLSQPTRQRFAGAIPLHGRCDNLLFPIDSQLVPQLHDEEARALVRERGLVIQPNGRALAFLPNEPVPLAALLSGASLAVSSWQALPTPPPRIDSIREIRLEEKRTTDDILNLKAALGQGSSIGAQEHEGAEDGDHHGKGGVDVEEEGDGSPPTTTGQSFRERLHQAQQALRRWARKARRALLPKRGAKARPKPPIPLRQRLAQWAMGMLAFPATITQSLLNRQRAALLRLLREFREGDPDKALRRALPAHDPKAQAVGPASHAILPLHNLLYSLRNLFGPSHVATWYGGLDLLPDLFAEYRRAAEKALKQGDYRRAAFIYGKLLHDYRMAANVLMQGCLYHDAGIVYLLEVEDRVAAAGAFEAAGELDRAVELYREAGEYALAGDALLQAGEEDAALAEYRKAAEECVQRSRDYLAAGELMATRALRIDLAVEYFSAGWENRPASNDVACALRLAQYFAEQEALEDISALVSEADTHFQSPGREDEAGKFYNEVARLADQDGLAAIRDDLRDRALMGLAGKLRQRASLEIRQGHLVSGLLGRSGLWKPVLVNDAAYAVQAALKHSVSQHLQLRKHDVPITTIPLGNDTVTAARSASQTGDLFVGFASGRIACFRPLSNRVTGLRSSALHVCSLATDATGANLVALANSAAATPVILSFLRDPQGIFHVKEKRHVEGSGPFWMTPLSGTSENQVLGLFDGNALKLLRGIRLMPEDSFDALKVDHPIGALLLHPWTGPRRAPDVLLFEAWRIRYFCLGNTHDVLVNWKPGVPHGNRIQTVTISWAIPNLGHLEVAAVGEDGVVYWSALKLSPERLDVSATSFSTTGEPYSAVVLIRPGFAAAVAGAHIDWFRCGARGLHPVARTPTALPPAVACFPSPATNELLIVCADGLLARVPIPS